MASAQTSNGHTVRKQRHSLLRERKMTTVLDLVQIFLELLFFGSEISLFTLNILNDLLMLISYVG